MKNKSKLIISFILIFFSSFLFMLANPNYFFSEGLPVLAWLYFIPNLYVINTNSIRFNWIYGFFYGFLSYFLYAGWLKNYGLVFLILVCILYGTLWAFNFFLLKYFSNLSKRNGWILQWLYVLLFEYIKTLGFAGFSYGITGYTQWKCISLIQIAKYTGVFGVSAIVLFPSFYLFQVYVLVKNSRDSLVKGKRLFVYLPFFIWVFLLVWFVIYGNYSKKMSNYESLKNVKITAIQNNDDPWANGVENYRKIIQDMIYLTEDSLEQNPDTELIVWPETAVVPSIEYYYEKEDSKRKILISSLLNYINSKQSCFVIGNAYIKNRNNEDEERFNSTLFFKPDENTLPPNPEIYSKNHLVPFSEYFPWRERFPFIEKILIKSGSYFWNKGEKINLFRINGFVFGTPICFEDTFSDIPRKMRLSGAKGFINLSNDSWAESLACQNQHLAMAVFRSVENNVSSLRSTSTGQTCYISSDGEIIKMAVPFCKTYITCDFEYSDDNVLTFYTKYGDLFIYFVAGLFVILLLKNLIIVIIYKHK